MHEIAEDRVTAPERSAPSDRHVVTASILIALATLQVGIIVAAALRIMDPGWATVETLGGVFWIASGVVIAAMVASPGRRSRPFLAVSGVAFVAAVVGAWMWADPSRGALLLSESQAARVGTLLAADAIFAAWLLIARFAGSIQRAPVLGGIALFAVVRAILETVVVLPTIQPRIPAGSTGTTVDVVAFLAAGLVLGGFIVFPLWEFALSRWILRGPTGVTAP